MRGFRFSSCLKKGPAARVSGLRPNTCRPAADETKLPVAREETPLVPRVAKDGHGLQPEKIGPSHPVSMLCLQKRNHEKNYHG